MFLQMGCVRIVRRRRLLVRHRAIRPDRQRRQRQTVLVSLSYCLFGPFTYNVNRIKLAHVDFENFTGVNAGTRSPTLRPIRSMNEENFET